MFRSKCLFIVFAVALIVIALTACNAPAQLATVPAPTTAVPASGAIVVTDALNRTVKFDKVPQRIVLAGKAFFMIVDAIYLSRSRAESRRYA